MASPHYNGIDERNGFLPVVEDVTGLQAQAGGYPGREVFVNSLRRSFILDPFSAETADGASVIACTSGGQWRLQGESIADILMRAQGILAETCSRANNAVATLALVSQQCVFSSIALRAGTLVSNITINVNVAGVAVSLSKVGLYSKAGVLLATSADQGTNWHSTGNKTIAMAVAYTVPTSDLYYVCVLCVFTSTAPVLLRGASGLTVGAGANAIGSGAIPFGIQASQADMPSPATIVVGSTTAFQAWAAIT